MGLLQANRVQRKVRRLDILPMTATETLNSITNLILRSLVWSQKSILKVLKNLRRVEKIGQSKKHKHYFTNRGLVLKSGNPFSRSVWQNLC